MLYGEVRKSVSGLLRGDNSKAEELLTTDETYLSMALREVSIRCKPLKLLEKYDEAKTDVFRRLYSTFDEIEDVYNHWYIRTPEIDINDSAEVDIDEELIQAVIFYMCSYLTNKKNINFSKRAEVIISIYQSNSVDFSQYE